MASFQQINSGAFKHSFISESLLSDVTCSLCLSLFEKPKTLPNCPHSFCLECLEKLASKSDPVSFNRIRCPECRAVNNLPINLSDLLTNIVAQNIVEKIKKQQAVHKTGDPAKPAGADCSHYLLGESRDRCVHCQGYFCDSCKYRHMDSIKESLTELLQEVEGAFSLPAAEDFYKMIQERIKIDGEAIRSRRDEIFTRFHDVLLTDLQDIRATQNIQLAMAERFNQVAEQMADVRKTLISIKRRQQSLLTSSVFRHSLQDVAELYNEANSANKAVIAARYLVKSIESPMLVVAPTQEADDLLQSLSTAQLFTLKFSRNVSRFLKIIGPSAIQSCRMAYYCSKAVQTDPIEPNTEAPKLMTPRKTLFSGHGSFLGSLITNRPRDDPMSYLNERSFRFTKNNPVSVIALPTQSEFTVALFSGGMTYLGFSNLVGEMNPANDFRIRRPLTCRRFHVKDLATDYRGTIFFTVYVEEHDGKVSKRIYRIWRTMFSPNYPDLFAISTYETDLDQQFNGIAISQDFGLVLTTEGPFVAAYDSINTLRGERGDRIKLWYVGPSPCLLAVSSSGSGGSLKLIVSIEDHDVLETLAVFPRREDGEDHCEEDDVVWNLADPRLGGTIQLSSSGHFAFHRGYAILYANSEIYLFSDVLGQPRYVARYPSLLDATEGAEMKSLALLINKSSSGDASEQTNWKGHVAVLDNKKTIIFAEMNDFKYIE